MLLSENSVTHLIRFYCMFQKSAYKTAEITLVKWTDHRIQFSASWHTTSSWEVSVLVHSRTTFSHIIDIKDDCLLLCQCSSVLPSDTQCAVLHIRHLDAALTRQPRQRIDAATASKDWRGICVYPLKRLHESQNVFFFVVFILVLLGYLEI